MSKLRKSQSGFLMAAIIIGAIMILGYVIISSFLGSDEGQTIQDTANKVIDTIESSSTE